MHFLSRFAALASFSAMSTSALASTYDARLLDVTVIDRDTGATLPTYTDRGKRYVAGTPDHRYSVRMVNRSGARVLAVLSVDGVNAVSGETAAPDQTGYVLDAWESAEIAGWRKNLDEIAQFNFTALPNSYAARSGRPDNVGVIGVAVFTERAPISRDPRIVERESHDAAGTSEKRRAEAPASTAAAESTAAAPRESRDSLTRAKAAPLGTGHGEREYAHVDSTTFERASSRPQQTLSIWYDSYTNLVARGVITRPIATRDPQPFPNGFVADPPAR